jgi:hypothetical protein
MVGKLLRKAALPLLALFCCMALDPAPVQAESVVWKVQSNFPKKVQIEFYSKDSNQAWPGGGEAYGLNDYKEHTYTLNCKAGERICYGAWVTGTERVTWGVGKDEAKGCSDCCWTCGRKGNPRAISLGPPREQRSPSASRGQRID